MREPCSDSPTVDKATALNVSLYHEQIQAVQDYASHTGLRNFSAALRMIITEWAREHNYSPSLSQEQPA